MLIGSKETPQKTPKHAKARFRDVFHHPGVVRSRVGASLSLRSSLGNVLTHVTSRKARKKHSLFHSYKKQRGNDKACSLIFITFQKSKTKRTTASRITFRPFHFTLSTPCCVLFAPRLASLSSSSVHAPTHIFSFSTTKHTLLHALMYLFPDHHPMLKNVRSSHFLRVYYTPYNTFPAILRPFGTRSSTFISPLCFRRVRASRSITQHLQHIPQALPQTPSTHIKHTFHTHSHHV